MISVQANPNINVKKSWNSIKVAPVTNVKTVTTTATALFAGASQLASRYNMTVYNESGNTVYFGQSGVTTATGFPLLAGDTVSFNFDISVATAIYFIGTTSSNVRVVELA